MRISDWSSDVCSSDLLGTPDILLMLSTEVAVFDNLKGRLYLVVHADPSESQGMARANRRLDELAHRLRHGGAGYPQLQQPQVLDEAHFVSGFSRHGFIAAVGDRTSVVSGKGVSGRVDLGGRRILN